MHDGNHINYNCVLCPTSYLYDLKIFVKMGTKFLLHIYFNIIFNISERTSSLLKKTTREKLTSDLRHTYMPSIFDAEAIKLRNEQAEKVFLFIFTRYLAYSGIGKESSVELSHGRPEVSLSKLLRVVHSHSGRKYRKERKKLKSNIPSRANFRVVAAVVDRTIFY